MATHPLKTKLAVGPIARPGPTGLEVRGMYGIGDCLFQRAVIRELMRRNDHVFLDSYYKDMYWDMERDGLHLNITKDKGRIKDSANRSDEDVIRRGIAPVGLRNTSQLRLTYDKKSIHQHGSILAAMFASANLTMPAQPDFSLPVKQEWVARWRLYLAQHCAKHNIKITKPILVYRPICLNTRWTATARAPDPAAYEQLYKSIRDKFFVVSICDLRESHGHREWIVGREPSVDLRLHHGQLDFATMCGLFRDAAMAFTNPGFTPVLAHAVGTPVVIVYGGNESFATTNIVGQHLSPTCAIDIDKPCPCHTQDHACRKKITIPPAKARVCSFTDKVLKGSAKPVVEREKPIAQDFAESVAGAQAKPPRVLIFGTMYCDTPERAELTRMWYELHSALNPTCDLMLVDSQSPAFKPEEFGATIDASAQSDGVLQRIQTEQVPAGVVPHSFLYFNFGGNIGHLSRNGPNGAKSKGRDGWGRAFCRGLDYATGKWDPSPALPNRGYDYVVHIEGDSLFKHPVLPIIERMQREGIEALTVPVKGTKREEKNWVETGLMFMEVDWLRKCKFTDSYDWPNRQEHPTPEQIIWGMFPLGPKGKLMSWSALRGDKNQITHDNICNLDWVTHVRNSKGLDDVKAFRKFVDRAIGQNPAPTSTAVPPPSAPAAEVSTRSAGTGEKAGHQSPQVRINLGCGTNKLAGWSNHDQDVNITRRLPWSNDHADFIFAEHVVEHIPYYKAIDFMKECLRVLKPGGVLRITTPSLEFLQQRGDDEYFKWTHEKGWAPSPDRRGAMHAILYCHGHQTAWTSSLLQSTMYYCGFEQTALCEVGKSKHAALIDVEGHGRVIGEHFNQIESLCVEGTKP